MESSTSWQAWGAMILAIFASSTLGPVFKYVTSHGVRPCLAASWRCQTMILSLLPLTYFELHKMKEIEWFSKKPDLGAYPLFVHVFTSGLFWSGSLLFWILGLMYTSTGVRISSLEYLGVGVAMVGIGLTTFSPDGEAVGPIASNSSFSSSALFGDFLCFLSSVSETLVIVNRQRTRAYVPLFTYTTATTVVVVVVATLLSLSLDFFSALSSLPPTATATTTTSSQATLQPLSSWPLFPQPHIFCLSNNCVFGWLSPDWFPFMVAFGAVIGVGCMGGFNFSLAHMSPLVFSSLTLVDPAVTGLISYLAGLEGVPDLWTMVGGVVVVLGVGVVLVGENRRDLREQQEMLEQLEQLEQLEEFEQGEQHEHVEQAEQQEMRGAKDREKEKEKAALVLSREPSGGVSRAGGKEGGLEGARGVYEKEGEEPDGNRVWQRLRTRTLSLSHSVPPSKGEVDCWQARREQGEGHGRVALEGAGRGHGTGNKGKESAPLMDDKVVGVYGSGESSGGSTV